MISASTFWTCCIQGLKISWFVLGGKFHEGGMYTSCAWMGCVHFANPTIVSELVEHRATMTVVFSSWISATALCSTALARSVSPSSATWMARMMAFELKASMCICAIRAVSLGCASARWKVIVISKSFLIKSQRGQLRAHMPR
jgi:hypothetical protein